jgi:hypothetical protein
MPADPQLAAFVEEVGFGPDFVAAEESGEKA